MFNLATRVPLSIKSACLTVIVSVLLNYVKQPHAVYDTVYSSMIVVGIWTVFYTNSPPDHTVLRVHIRENGINSFLNASVKKLISSIKNFYLAIQQQCPISRRIKSYCVCTNSIDLLYEGHRLAEKGLLGILKGDEDFKALEAQHQLT